MSKTLKRLAVLTLCFLLTFTTGARADYTYDEGFEHDPASRWGGIPWGDGSLGFDINRGQARTGGNNAWMLVEVGGSAQAHGVGFPNFAGQCAAQIYAKASSNNTRLVLEVWAHEPIASGALEWRMRNSKEYWLNSGGYQPYGFGTTPSVFGGTRALHYRVFLHGGGPGQLKMVRLDDFFMRCW